MSNAPSRDPARQQEALLVYDHYHLSLQVETLTLTTKRNKMKLHQVDRSTI